MLVKLRTLGANFTTFLLALVPVFKSCPPCPICVPKYAAILALFGLELDDYSHYLIPIMLLCMLLSLSSMYYQVTKKRLPWYPFILAVSACSLLLIFKYIFNLQWVVYVMMLGLLCALLWHYRYLALYRTCCTLNSAN